MASDTVLVLSRWLYFGSVMILFGSSVFPLYAFRRTTRPADALLPRARSLALAATALVSTVVWLLAFAANLGTPEDLAATASAVLFESGLGVVWMARLCAACLLLIASAWGEARLIAGPAFLLLACEGWSGHASAGNIWASLIHALHIVCAGAWIGALVPLARLVEAARRDLCRIAVAEAALWRFSHFGVVIVGLIASSGAVNTWRMLGDGLQLADSYDRVLLLKIGLFVAMVALAALNRYRLLGALHRPDATSILKALSRNITLEQVIGAGILLDVSALGLMNPEA
jgi:copper resistance protein D